MSIYVILPRCKKPANDILNIVLILSLLILLDLFFVIFFKMSFVISKCIAFYFRKSFFLCFIMSDKYSMSKASRLKWLLI